MKRLPRALPILSASLLAWGGVDLAAANPTTKVLYLGDSLSMGTFGKTFDTSMREAGFEVHTVVAGGATPYYWLKEYQALPCTVGVWEKSKGGERRLGYVRAVPKLEDLLSLVEPNVVVVQTGINLYATLRSKRKPKEENVTEVTSLIERMCHAIAGGGAASYWVLPPHSHEQRYSRELQDELAGLMRGVVLRYEGAVFESQEVTRFVDPYPATDGIHYGPTEARGWAEKVSVAFNDYMKVEPAAPKELAALPPPPVSSPPSAAVAEPRAASEIPEEVALRIRLEEKSEVRNLTDIAYANALGLYEYRVVKDMRGNYPFDRIRVAQGIIFGRKLTGASRAAIGSEIDLVMVPLSRYKSLAAWQMIDDLRPNFEIPIYTPKLD